MVPLVSTSPLFSTLGYMVFLSPYPPPPSFFYSWLLKFKFIYFFFSFLILPKISMYAYETLSKAIPHHIY